MRRAMLLCLALAAGCDACGDARKAVAREMKSPPEDQAEKLLRETLRTAKETAAKMCGLESASGLEVEKAKLRGSLFAGSGHWEIEGKPIDPKLDGGIAPAKALTCIAIVYAGYRVVKSDAEGNPSEWKLSSHDLEEVKTPGAEWVKPVEVDD